MGIDRVKGHQARPRPEKGFDNERFCAGNLSRVKFCNGFCFPVPNPSGGSAAAPPPGDVEKATRRACCGGGCALLVLKFLPPVLLIKKLCPIFCSPPQTRSSGTTAATRSRISPSSAARARTSSSGMELRRSAAPSRRQSVARKEGGRSCLRISRISQCPRRLGLILLWRRRSPPYRRWRRGRKSGSCLRTGCARSWCARALVRVRAGRAYCLPRGCAAGQAAAASASTPARCGATIEAKLAGGSRCCMSFIFLRSPVANHRNTLKRSVCCAATLACRAKRRGWPLTAPSTRAVRRARTGRRSVTSVRRQQA